MTNFYAPNELDLVFGADSTGDTPEARVKTSKTEFVRGQLQLATFSVGATGRVIASREALSMFGWPTLLQATVEGSAPLVTSPKEPATTLRTRRLELGLTQDHLARRLKVTVADIQRTETDGTRSPIRIIESFGQAVALNEQILGFSPKAEKDTGLGVRLRNIAFSKEIPKFTSSTVLQLSEAAWVISRQTALQNQLQEFLGAPRATKPKPRGEISYPAYEMGYLLAQETRKLLGLNQEDPIPSVRKIIEDDFGISLIQLRMNPSFAGATIANGSARGIVVNESGLNSDVWIRRMTLCHELCHLLWDPNELLKNVTVDRYTDVEMSDRAPRRDASEVRANSFSVAFLAPPEAVQRIAKKHTDPVMVVSEVMSKYGISATAAKHHLKNVANFQVSSVQRRQLPTPEDHWEAMENSTLDHFPIASTPLARSGKFSWCIANAFRVGHITLDSAASWLSAKPADVTAEALDKLIEWRK